MVTKSGISRSSTILVVCGVLLGSAPGAVPPGEGGAFTVDGANVVFISITNLRADHLGLYGYGRKTSPTIDTFGKGGLVFDAAFSHASWTLPVALSLFTSQYPFTHGLMNRKDYRPLAAGTATFVDILKKHGYVTAAFVGDRDYGKQYGHTSRFHEVNDYVNDQNLEDWKRYGVLENTVPPALTWLRRNRARKFCLFIQGYDTHCPFSIPRKNAVFDPGYTGDIDFDKCYWTFRRTKPIRMKTEAGDYEDVYLLKTKPEAGSRYDIMFYPDDVRHMIALYDGEIQLADGYVGRILAELTRLGLDEKTIVVLFSEHGDMFGKYGRFMRGGPLRGTFYDDVLRVPLVVRHPHVAPKRINGLAQIIDVAPTVLDMLGIERPASFRGKSLRPLIERETPVNPFVFAGSAFTPKKNHIFFRTRSIITAVRGTRWKLIHEKLFYDDGNKDYYELFDLAADPEELTNVRTDNVPTFETLRRELSQWLEAIGADTIRKELGS